MTAGGKVQKLKLREEAKGRLTIEDWSGTIVSRQS
jgi:hypothetical protein